MSGPSFHVEVPASVVARVAIGRGQRRRRQPPTKNGIAFRPNLAHLCQKTKLCLFFLHGACDLGSRCRFAHGEEELQVTPMLTCTKMCPRILSGQSCPKGILCKFAHDLSELRHPIGIQDAVESSKLVQRTKSKDSSVSTDIDDDRSSSVSSVVGVDSGWQTPVYSGACDWPTPDSSASSSSEWLISIGQLPHSGIWKVHASTGLEVSVQNTFIDAREPLRECIPRRSKSLPPSRP